MSALDSIDAGSMASGLAGRLLVSMPSLDEGAFERAVVLMCAHDRDHAFGLIVNRPIDGVLAGDAVADLKESAEESTRRARVFYGGPVDSQRGMILHASSFHREETITVGGGLSITGSKAALQALHGPELPPATSRLLAGHAGWSAGQLDAELRRNLWLDMEASAAFVFGQNAEDLWDAAIAHIGIAHSSLSALSAEQNPSSRPLN